MRVCVFRRVLLQRLNVQAIEAKEMMIAVHPIVSTTAGNCNENNSEMNTVVEEVTVDDYCDSEFLQHLYHLSFSYIQDVYERCRNQNMNDSAFEIFSNFIAVGSANEVNISGTNRTLLTDFFNNDGNIQRTAGDYLWIFNESVVGVYSLLNSVYRFQFVTQALFKVEEN